MGRGNVGKWERGNVLGGVSLLLIGAVCGNLGVTRIDNVDNIAAADKSAAVWFTWVDVYVDSGDEPLGAYQFELNGEGGQFEIVGVEGGEHAAFAEPPFYDSAALYAQTVARYAEDMPRIIIAAYSLDKDLPVGLTRVARVHVMVTGDAPTFGVNLVVAGSADGEPISAEAAAVEGETQ